MTMRVRFAYLVAAIAYAALSTAFLMQAAAAGQTIPVLIMSYLFLATQLVAVTWFLRISAHQRLSTLLGYSLIGCLLALLLLVAKSKGILWLLKILFYPPGGPLTFLQTPVGLFVICPLAGLYFLRTRRTQPFLALLAASLLYIWTVAIAFHWLYPTKAIFRDTLTKANAEFPWLIPAGLANVVLGVILAGSLLRLLSRSKRKFWVAILAMVGVVIVGCGMPLHGAPLVLLILSTTAWSTLGVLFVWAVFKVFVWLQEQGRWLTTEIIAVHFCWTYLTLCLLLYAWGFRGSLFSGSGLSLLVLSLGCGVTLALHLVVLHVLLWRIRAPRPIPAPKRLLLLRTFGRADEPEDLIDTLDDTWRRIGSVDLLAGSDVASRTLRSTMLEAFLLRRSEDQFLKTNEEVDKRLLNEEGDKRLLKLRSEVEADARYPVNGVFCYVDAWKRAFIRLVQDADAVLMDLQGFTVGNQSCIWELTHLVKHTPLRRILLLVDGGTELPALRKAAQEAWAHLPLDSPNANDQEPEIKFLIYDPRREADGHRLFSLLLEAAEDSAGINPYRPSSGGYTRPSLSGSSPVAGGTGCEYAGGAGAEYGDGGG